VKDFIMKKMSLRSVLLVFAFSAILASQSSFSQDITSREKLVEKVVEAQAAVEPAVLGFFNRPIIILRASVFGHSPSVRVRLIEERFSEYVKAGKINTISTQPSTEGTVILIDGELLMLLSNNDLDPLSNGTMESTVKDLSHKIENVLELIRKQKDPKTNLIGGGISLAGLLVYIFLVISLNRLQRWLKPKIYEFEDRLDMKMSKLGFSRFSIQLHFFALINKLIYWAIVIFATYTLVTVSLNQFPYTEPWGKKLGGYILDIIEGLTSRIVDSIPSLFVAFVIFLLTYWIVRLSKTFFNEIAKDRIALSWLEPEAALPTSKICTAIIWVFGVVMAYPYIPGSNTDAFKGIGVFLGLLISLGASSMVGQVIGGMVLMYSRAMKVGDIVHVGENYGRVLEIGFFSTKLHTMKNEEVNIPNSVLMGSITKNYSRLSKSEGLIVHSTITIGYDAPWRQVHAMLLNAAERTSGIQKKPEPFVLQKALSDFYVEYEINAFVERPEGYLKVMTELHANIQDEFNKYGVQIMSPHFEGQPNEKVWVPEGKWHEAPAKK
jgi:small-conductance mechanosensitive channel